MPYTDIFKLSDVPIRTSFVIAERKESPKEKEQFRVLKSMFYNLNLRQDNMCLEQVIIQYNEVEHTKRKFILSGYLNPHTDDKAFYFNYPQLNHYSRMIILKRTGMKDAELKLCAIPQNEDFVCYEGKYFQVYNLTYEGEQVSITQTSEINAISEFYTDWVAGE